MSHLRLVQAVANGDAVGPVPADDRPRVSLRMLMALSGRCSCDDCLWAYRRGDKSAGIVRGSAPSPRITAVR